MKINSAEFQTSAPDLRNCPDFGGKAEFAFIGRSNVGKSSLVNMLTGKKNLAKVSATPGKTRLLNFFAINKTWILVDLPGYGFAKGARSESYDFGTAVANYLEKRDTLRRVFVLIDSMLPPQGIDIQFLRWLNETATPFALVFTKTDRQSPTATRRAIDTFLAALEEAEVAQPPVLGCSAKNGEGKADLLQQIAQDLSKAPEPRAQAESQAPTHPIFKPAKLQSPAKSEAKPKDEDFEFKRPSTKQVWKP